MLPIISSSAHLTVVPHGAGPAAEPAASAIGDGAFGALLLRLGETFNLLDGSDPGAPTPADAPGADAETGSCLPAAPDGLALPHFLAPAPPTGTGGASVEPGTVLPHGKSLPAPGTALPLQPAAPAPAELSVDDPGTPLGTLARHGVAAPLPTDPVPVPVRVPAALLSPATEPRPEPNPTAPGAEGPELIRTAAPRLAVAARLAVREGVEPSAGRSGSLPEIDGAGSGLDPDLAHAAPPRPDSMAGAQANPLAGEPGAPRGYSPVLFQPAPAGAAAGLEARIGAAVEALQTAGEAQPARMVLALDRFGPVDLRLTRTGDTGLGIHFADAAPELRLAVLESVAQRQQLDGAAPPPSATTPDSARSGQPGANTYERVKQQEARSGQEERASRGRDGREGAGQQPPGDRRRRGQQTA